eukprot:GEMP01016790.1.p1 GENE.GEMP01016790.1~~GEMP01016790.1.p1  ORF type:complete len:744 (+),score=178.77 GEMP01016790.1:17-2248(+)
MSTDGREEDKKDDPADDDAASNSGSSHAASSAKTQKRDPEAPVNVDNSDDDSCSDKSSAHSDTSVKKGVIPDEERFEDDLLSQQPLDTRMFIFDPDMQKEPMSPAEHAKVDDVGTGDGEPWHAFELPLAQATYEQCFAKDPNAATDAAPLGKTPPHYQHVLERSVDNFTHMVHKGGAKVMTCGTEQMQGTLTKYVKLIVQYVTRRFFFVKPDDHKDVTMMYIPVRCKESIHKVLPTIESLTGTLTLFFDGPEVEVQDTKSKWRRGTIERWVNKDTVSVMVGKRAVDVSIEDVRSVTRDSDDALPLAIFAPDERKRLICMAYILRTVADLVDKLPTKHMFHPMISLRKYTADDEKLLVSISQKFEAPLTAATNCSVIIAKSQNIAILVGTAAEKQLCAVYIQCMMENDIPSRADALLMPRPEGFQSKLEKLIHMGEETKTFVFIKSDKLVVMSPSFLRRAHAFLRVANLVEEVDPGYVQRLHFPVDSAGVYKVSEIDSQYGSLDAERRQIYENKLEQLGMATGGAVAVMKKSLYAIGTEEAKRNIIQYTRWFFMDPTLMVRDRTGPGGPNALCVSIDAAIDVPQLFFRLLAKYFKVFAIPYPGMEKSVHVQNIWLVGPNRPLASAATALRWYAQNAELRDFSPSKHRSKKPTIHTAPPPLFSQPATVQPAVAAAPQPVMAQPVMAQPMLAQPAMLSQPAMMHPGMMPAMPFFPGMPHMNPLMGNPFANPFLLLQASMEAKRRRL